MKTLSSLSKLVVIILSLSIISAKELPKPLAAEPSTVTVTCDPTSVPYTGSAHTHCTAIWESDGASGSLTVTYVNNINVGTATASASFAGDELHDPADGSTTFAITKSPTTVTVTCPANLPYDGTAQEPCTASYTSADLINEPLDVTYSNNTNAGTASASASYAGDADHAAGSGGSTFVIDQVAATCTAEPYNEPYT
ncbi:hypothetical protein ACFLXB_08460, partial [Chloroflexota bacterium]